MNNTHKKIGGFTTFAMLVGSVVGIGIFLKNHGVFKTTGFNPTTTIIAWAIAAVVCLFLSISYSRISSTAQSRAGLAGWIEKLGFHKFGRFVSFSFPVFYFGVLLPGMSYFVAELLLNIVDAAAGTKLLSDGLGKHSTIGLIVGIGFIFYLAIFTLNYYSLVASGWVSKISLFIKFIPLIAVVVMGILVTVMLTGAASLSLFRREYILTPATNTEPAVKNQTDLTVSGLNLILVALPSILFTFDSFISVGSLAPDVKNSRKNMPRVVIFGMIVIATTYLLITVAQIQLGTGIAWNAFNEDILKKLGLSEAVAKKIYSTLKVTVIVLIFISAIGVLNGMTATAMNNSIFIIEKRIFVFAGFFLKIARNNLRLAGVIALFFINLFWTVFYLVLSFLSNSDAFIDGITNFPTLFFFIIFGLVPVLWIFRRIKYCEKFSFRFLIEILIAVIGLLLSWTIVFYQIFYTFLYDALVNKNEIFSTWGGFADTTRTFSIKRLYTAIVFLSAFGMFLLLPFLNFGALKILNWFKYRKYYNVSLLENEEARKLAEAKVKFYSENGHPQEIPGTPNVVAPQVQDELHTKNTAFLLDTQDDPLSIVLKKERNIRLAREEYLRKIRSSNF